MMRVVVFRTVVYLFPLYFSVLKCIECLSGGGSYSSYYVFVFLRSAITKDQLFTRLLEIEFAATSTCDGMFLLLLALFSSRTAASKKVHCLLNYLKGTKFQNTDGHQVWTKLT